MAGERLRPAGWSEISGVCTDEAVRGQGLAGRLVRAVAHEMHRQICSVHPAVGRAMTHVDTEREPRLERILSEMRTEARQRAAAL